MSVLIRSAIVDDAPALTACVTRAYAAYETRIPDLPDVAAGLEQDIADHVVWVAERDGAILGGIVLILGTETATLANVAVDPDARGLGVGRHLITTAEDTCRQRGIPALILSTHVEMPENLRLYEHLGWQVTGQSGNKVHMTKKLGAEKDNA
ncbi:MAG: GNAT family N-acetyltransferase [Paracoccaceae bacterium]